MKNLLTALVAIAVAGLVFYFWGIATDHSSGVPASRPVVEKTEAEAPNRNGGASVAAFDPVAHLRRWAPGAGEPSPVIDRPLGPNIPRAVGEIEVMCRGKDVTGANTLELKKKIQELINAKLTDAEKDAMADYFRKCEDPTTKYFMLVAFRYFGDDHFVDAVADYYESDKAGVLESLSYIVTRSPRASDAFSRILEKEVDPARREDLIARSGLQKSKYAEPFLLEVYKNPQSPADARAALMGLAHIDDVESKSILRSVVEGEFRSAGYDELMDPAPDAAMGDLRAHATLGLLMHGGVDDVRYLLQRYRTARADDPVAAYVTRYANAIQHPEVVRDAVDILVEKGVIPDDPANPLAASWLPFVERNARIEDAAAVSRLLGIAKTEAQRKRIQDLLDRLH